MDEEYTTLLRNFLTKERHHIKEIILNNKFEITDVIWDYKYVDPEQYCRGYKKLGHHTCKKCERIVLHLLGEKTDKNRICLKCGGYKKVPHWYYLDKSSDSTEEEEYGWEFKK